MKTPVIKIEGLKKSFGNVDVLKGIDLEAVEGDVISIIGSSGSGKSTLLRCLNLLERPTEGTLSLFDEQLKLEKDSDNQLASSDRNQLTRIRSKVGFVFQNFNLWPHMTIIDNLIEAPMQVLGLSKSDAIERATSLLERVGLTEHSHRYPSQLSGGQQQRVAIARALAMDPEVLLFDEPTSALDPELVGEVLAVIRGLAKEGRTMLIVTHEMRFAREVSNKVIFLHQGMVEESGTPQQLFEQPKSQRCREFVATEY
ncbi:MAG: ATP-binding cassette domain-containing protein [Aliivibrio sp.]|uniref:ATP-binding cassette domain-containing protein n=1 Tax=Aliivibrio sp. TaxID=1872443 RepID=UPI001A5FA184|nr:ATP-binding cassette domain-containing protein [Aliivibrio sp.]